MRVEQLHEVHRARPFQPFVLRLADGRQVEVRHPELLSLAPNGRVVAVVEPDESSHLIDPMLVTEIEVPLPPSASSRPPEP